MITSCMITSCLTRKTVHPIIDEYHELYGHVGSLKYLRMLSETSHYPRFANLIRKRIASCKSCQLNKITNQNVLRGNEKCRTLKAQRNIIHRFLRTSTCYQGRIQIYLIHHRYLQQICETVHTKKCNHQSDIIETI